MLLSVSARKVRYAVTSYPEDPTFTDITERLAAAFDRHGYQN